MPNERLLGVVVKTLSAIISHNITRIYVCVMKNEAIKRMLRFFYLHLTKRCIECHKMLRNFFFYFGCYWNATVTCHRIQFWWIDTSRLNVLLEIPRRNHQWTVSIWVMWPVHVRNRSNRSLHIRRNVKCLIWNLEAGEWTTLRTLYTKIVLM